MTTLLLLPFFFNPKQVMLLNQNKVKLSNFQWLRFVYQIMCKSFFMIFKILQNRNSIYCSRLIYYYSTYCLHVFVLPILKNQYLFLMKFESSHERLSAKSTSSHIFFLSPQSNKNLLFGQWWFEGEVCELLIDLSQICIRKI